MSVSRPEYGTPPIERGDMERVWDRARAEARREASDAMAQLRIELPSQIEAWLGKEFPKTKLTAAQKESLSEAFGPARAPAGLTPETDPAA
jgi:hypothetical protein